MSTSFATPGRRGFLVLAALTLTAAAIVAPAQAAAPSSAPLDAIPAAVEARATMTDSLWVAAGASKNGRFAACMDPASAESLTSCFAEATNGPSSSIVATATDGVNVYFAGTGGGVSCPVADQGANCTHIMAGPWGAQNPNEPANFVTALVASSGDLWIGQNTGAIYRCPNNLPYVAQQNMPSGCALYATARAGVDSMLLANGTLYVGVASTGPSERNQGFIWACDPQVAGSCTVLDTYGNRYANSMAVGAGHLWVGIGGGSNGILWRCDVSAANSCDNWDTAGNWVMSVSYGQGTVYASVNSKKAKQSDGVVWSCSTSVANACSNLLTGIGVGAVAAGAGSVFSSNYQGSTSTLSFGTSPYTQATAQNVPWQSMVYVPAAGPLGVGGVSARVKPTSAGRGLKRDCTDTGGNPKARIKVKGPHGVSVAHTVDLCRFHRGKAVTTMFDLLDPGSYVVTVTAKRSNDITRVTVQEDRTTAVTITLPRAAWRR